MLLNNSSLKKNLIFGALLAASAALVIAGDGGQEFEAVYEMIEGWATGTLGKIIALAALIVGIGFGLVRQSVIAAVIGISMALVLNFGPSVISNILTATGEVDILSNGITILSNTIKRCFHSRNNFTFRTSSNKHS